MVHSEAVDVDAYLAVLPRDRQAALTRLRELCLTELTGFTEVMAYGMPGYARNGEIEFGFASQKQYISVYLLRTDVRDAFAADLAAQAMGKGCLRFRNPAKIDFVLIQNLLKATAATKGKIC